MGRRVIVSALVEGPYDGELSIHDVEILRGVWEGALGVPASWERLSAIEVLRAAGCSEAEVKQLSDRNRSFSRSAVRGLLGTGGR